MLRHDISRWLEKFLQCRYRKHSIHVADTHSISLASHLFRHGLHQFFPEYCAWDIRIDVIGVIVDKQQASLIQIGCQESALTLSDIAVYTAHSRIVKPQLSLVLSPAGLSTRLGTLLQTYGRYDVLEYDKQRRIRLARWDIKRGEIDYSSVLPPGELLRQRE